MRTRIRNRVVWLAGLVAGGAIIALILVPHPQKPLPPLPVPNGYDSFLKAINLVSSLGTDDFSGLADGPLRQLIATNREVFRSLRLGLSQRCAVPLDFATTNSTNFSAILMSKLPSMSRLANLLVAEGRVAELDHRPADAARSYTDCIRFGNELSRGGLVVNRLVGLTCEGTGYRPLLKVLPKLSNQELGELTQALDEIRRARVPWDEVWRTERRFGTLAGRQSRAPFSSLLSAPAQWQYKARFQRADSKFLAQLSLLSIELALRCYRAENGNPPEQLDQLSPKYLKAIPLDPFTGRPLIYRPQGTNWVLYSVGPDRRNDGGQPVTKGSSANVGGALPFLSDTVRAGDVFYNSVW